jgi:hypothetical protein
MLNQAGRDPAPFHLEFKQTRQTGAGASHWATNIIVHQKSPVFHVSPTHSSRSLICLIQVHPDESAFSTSFLHLSEEVNKSQYRVV